VISSLQNVLHMNLEMYVRKLVTVFDFFSKVVDSISRHDSSVIWCVRSFWRGLQKGYSEGKKPKTFGSQDLKIGPGKHKLGSLTHVLLAEYSGGLPPTVFSV